MPALGAYAQSLVLNYLSNAVANTRPAAWGLGLSQGVPSSTSGSEIAVTSNYSRLTCLLGTPGASVGSNTNISNITFGPLSAATISGVQIWDTVLSNNSGNMLWYGLLTTPRTLIAGDSLVVASGALTISLA